MPFFFMFTFVENPANSRPITIEHVANINTGLVPNLETASCDNGANVLEMAKPRVPTKLSSNKDVFLS